MEYRVAKTTDMRSMFTTYSEIGYGIFGPVPHALLGSKTLPCLSLLQIPLVWPLHDD